MAVRPNVAAEAENCLSVEDEHAQPASEENESRLHFTSFIGLEPQIL
jgi:hypothetical protein